MDALRILDPKAAWRRIAEDANRPPSLAELKADAERAIRRLDRMLVENRSRRDLAEQRTADRVLDTLAGRIEAKLAKADIRHGPPGPVVEVRHQSTPCDCGECGTTYCRTFRAHIMGAT